MRRIYLASPNLTDWHSRRIPAWERFIHRPGSSGLDAFEDFAEMRRKYNLECDTNNSGIEEFVTLYNEQDELNFSRFLLEWS